MQKASQHSFILCKKNATIIKYMLYNIFLFFLTNLLAESCSLFYLSSIS